jgi:putative ABC transport system ATP-binding protein
MNPHIQFKNVTREYDFGSHQLKAVDDISFSINAGEFVVILGPSGAGKSTVLNLLGGLDKAQTGEIWVDGLDLLTLSDNQLTDYRAAAVGFVFQFYNLIPSLTVLENIVLIKKIAKTALDASQMLEQVGLLDHADQFPAQLSGGEQQRVSIARAIAKNPKMLLCDEPTGALDSQNGLMVMRLLEELCRRQNKTVVVVTHNEALGQAADRVIRIKNGGVQQIVTNPYPLPISEVSW